MLLSYTFQSLSASDQDSGTHTYTITDSDFVETITVSLTGCMEATDMLAVISVYEKRNLPVAPNLVRAMQQLSGFVERRIDYIHRENATFNPKWYRYEQDIDKYMVLM